MRAVKTVRSRNLRSVAWWVRGPAARHDLVEWSASRAAEARATSAP